MYMLLIPHQSFEKPKPIQVMDVDILKLDSAITVAIIVVGMLPMKKHSTPHTYTSIKYKIRRLKEPVAPHTFVCVVLPKSTRNADRCRQTIFSACKYNK
jgi:hypothetical protein